MIREEVWRWVSLADSAFKNVTPKNLEMLSQNQVQNYHQNKFQHHYQPQPQFLPTPTPPLPTTTTTNTKTSSSISHSCSNPHPHHDNLDHFTTQSSQSTMRVSELNPSRDKDKQRDQDKNKNRDRDPQKYYSSENVNKGVGGERVRNDSKIIVPAPLKNRKEELIGRKLNVDML